MPQAQPQKSSHTRKPTNGHPEAGAPDAAERDGHPHARHPVADLLKDKAEQVTKKTRMEYLAKVVTDRARITKQLRTIPARMQKVTNQAQLVLELVDDFRDNKYRKIPWYSMAIASASLLYAVSPGDVLPDYLLGLGAVDDILVIGVALRLIKNDLKAYCEFKGYDPAKYF